MIRTSAFLAAALLAGPVIAATPVALTRSAAVALIRPAQVLPVIKIRHLPDAGIDDPACFGGPRSPMTNGYAAPDAKIHVEQTDGRVRVDYDTGRQWGVGFSLLRVADITDLQSVSALGSDGLNLKLEGPRGLKLQVFVNESGCDAASVYPQKGDKGADGESFGFPLLRCGGGSETLRVRWDQAQPHSNWGNQHGNHTLDLQALKYIDVVIVGAQGAGVLWIDEACTTPNDKAP